MGLKASKIGLENADKARKRRYPIKYSPVLAADALVEMPTVRRFWQRKIIRIDNFKSICQALGINWEEIYDPEESTTPIEFISQRPSPNDSPLPPFGDQGCIRDPTRFFNRKEILNQLYEALRIGQSRSLVGESEIGKSSILWKICQEGWQRLNLQRKAFIYLNMEIISSYESFFTALCQALAIKLDIRSVSFGLDLNNRLEGKRYIVCIDEIEVFREDFPPEDLPKTLRLLRGLTGSSQAPLTLVTASRSPLKELFPDTPKTSSPFWNIFRKIDVDVFSEEDASQFLQHRLQGNSITFTEDQINQLIADSNCHPARLQEQAAILYCRSTQE